MAAKQRATQAEKALQEEIAEMTRQIDERYGQLREINAQIEILRDNRTRLEDKLVGLGRREGKGRPPRT